MQCLAPVLRVRYKVDSTRVGQETNLDKLLLTVETNGAISPWKRSRKQLQFWSTNIQLLLSTTVRAAPALGQEDEEERANSTPQSEELNLTARTANALVNNDIRTVHDLVTLSEQDLRELKENSVARLSMKLKIN